MNAAGQAAADLPILRTWWWWRGGLAAFAASFFAFSVHGRYFHDSAFLLEHLERGEWLWVHLAYLPLGQLSWLLGAPFGWSAEVALTALSIACGTLLVLLHFELAGRVAPKPSQALLVALLTALAPAVWFGATAVEIHVLAGLGSSAGAWLCTPPRRGALPWGLRAGLATFVAGACHLSGVVLAPGFALLAWRSARATGFGATPRERWRLAGLSAFSIASAVLGLRALVSQHPGGGVSSSAVQVEHLAQAMCALLLEPRLLGMRVWDEVLAPWGLLALAPLAACFLPTVLGRGWACLLAGASALLALAVAASPAQAGQYGMILAPIFAMAAAGVVDCAAHQRWRVATLGGLLLAQGAVFAAQRPRLAHDPDREWAAQVHRAVEPGSALLCSSQARARRIETAGLHAASIELGAAVPDRARELETGIGNLLQLGDTPVYLDDDLFTGAIHPYQREVALELRKRLELELRLEPTLWRVRALRADER